jgi:hypothetical protein
MNINAYNRMCIDPVLALIAHNVAHDYTISYPMRLEVRQDGQVLSTRTLKYAPSEKTKADDADAVMGALLDMGKEAPKLWHEQVLCLFDSADQVLSIHWGEVYPGE